MTSTSSDGADSKEIEERIAGILKETFPNADERLLQFSVESLTDAPSWAKKFYHKGFKDVDVLSELQKNIRSIETALHSLSEPSQECLSDYVFRRQRKNTPMLDCGDTFRLPLTIEEIQITLDNWRRAAAVAERLRLKYGRPKGKAIWEAVPLVEQSRIVWDFHRESPLKTAPDKGLNPASPFGDFLQDVLDALGIKMDAVSAFKAWLRERRRPDSIIGVL